MVVVVDKTNIMVVMIVLIAVEIILRGSCDRGSRIRRSCYSSSASSGSCDSGGNRT